MYTKYFDEVSKTAFLNPLALGDLIFKLTVKLGPQRIQVIQFYTNQISTCVMEVREKVQFQQFITQSVKAAVVEFGSVIASNTKEELNL